MMHTKLIRYHVKMSEPAQKRASAFLNEQLSLKDYIQHFFEQVWSKQMEFASK